jgi:hypothetical protein
VLQAAVRKGAANVDDSRLAIHVAVLEREPFAGTQPGGRGEEHHRTVMGAERSSECVELRPRLERPLLLAAPGWVVDPDLRRVLDEHLPGDRTLEYLAQRLRRLEPMSRRNRHPPGGDLVWAKLGESPIAERRHGLR